MQYVSWWFRIVLAAKLILSQSSREWQFSFGRDRFVACPMIHRCFSGLARVCTSTTEFATLRRFMLERSRIVNWTHERVND
jgi:hypothetical protein